MITYFSDFRYVNSFRRLFATKVESCQKLRPTNLTFGKISNGHIFARGRPIHFMFYSTWGFRGRRVEWRYFRFRQIQDGAWTAILENSNGDISAADHPIYSVFDSAMGSALIPI